MGRLVKLSDGTWGPHPDIRKDAVRLKHKLYGAKISCPSCGFRAFRFTTTDNCIMCQRFKIDLIRYYSQTRRYDTWPKHIDKRLVEDRKMMDEVVELADAVTAGKFILGGEPCKTHGHIPLSVKGRPGCHHCDTMGTLKQQAHDAGAEHYVVTSPCRGCGDHTLRNTADDSCVECGYIPYSNKPERDRRTAAERTETPDQVFMRENPDMVLGKDEAEMCGLKVYRTGNACRKGHAGWRYISTGNCIECLKG